MQLNAENQSPAPFSLSFPAAANYVGISVRTLQRYVAENKLPVRKVGGRSLILRADLERLVTGEAA